MKKKCIRTLICFSLLFLLPLLMNINLQLDRTSQNNETLSSITNEEDKLVRLSAPDLPIHITGSNWTYAVGNGTATGSGNWEDPYIIQDKIIDADQANYGIRIENSEKVYFRIENCTIYNAFSAGISLYEANNGTLINNNCSFNDDGVGNENNDVGSGIYLSLSENNTIINNILCNNSEYGLYIASGAHNNTAQGNIILNNGRFGIKVGTTDYNKFYNNHIENSHSYGFATWNGDNMVLKGNTIIDNGNNGMHFYITSDNIITENLIIRNNNGIYLYSNSGTSVFKNYFLNNTVNAYCNQLGNSFDLAGTGNYWDDYTGSDNSPYDGIGDISYDNIAGSTIVDNYPILELPYYTNETIHIDETRTNAMNWTRMAYFKDYITGSGIYSDPFIIQDLTINAKEIGDCIRIENSEMHFRIKNCTLLNSSSSDAAICLDKVKNAMILNNNIMDNNGYGIYFNEVNNSIVQDNNLTKNYDVGISLNFNCWNNSLIRNIINESLDHGIYLGSTAYDNTVINNQIHNNTGNSRYGIYLYNGAYYNNVSLNYIYNNSGSSRSAIVLSSSANWNNISKNIIEQNEGNGIYLTSHSSYNRIFQNSILNNSANGISIFAPTDGLGCDNNNITENEIKYNLQNGIRLSGSMVANYLRAINILNNNISYNTQHGIHLLLWISDIIICKNNISSNGPSGLYHGIFSSNYSVANINITENIISNHSGIGIALTDIASNSLIYNNSFKSNYIHAQDNYTGASRNQWNNTDTGNYWDNYTEMGAGAVDADDNGRGDIPYNVSGTANSQDHWPLWEDGDDVPPFIIVNSPFNDTTWASAPFISVSVLDQNLAYIWYNVTGNPTKEFLVNNFGENLNDNLWAGLPQGPFQITFFANDTFGQTSNLTLTYLKDSKPPEITFNIILDNSFWNKEPIINVTTFDAHSGDIWYNITGNNTIFPISNNSQQLLDSYLWGNLPEGPFQISFFANDSLGNLNNTVLVTLVKDTVDPSVSIDRIIEHGYKPPDFELTIIESNLESTWYTLDNGTTNRTFSGSTGVIAQDIWDSAEVGNLTLIFYARDFAGNIVSQAINVTKEEAPLNGGEEPPDLTIIIIIVIAIVAGVSVMGIVLVKRSKKKVREVEAEIKTLKEQREEITEGDILISKEKHICLVHKGPVEGMSYICPECGAYYCVKCYNVIKEAENECWSCNTPLDISRPSKKIGKADDRGKKKEEIEIKEEPEIEFEKDEKIHKKPKSPLSQPSSIQTTSDKKLTIKAPPVEKAEEKTEPKKAEAEEEIKEDSSPSKIQAIKKFDEYIEQLNAMVQKLDIKFNAGALTQDEYLEKKTMLAEKLGEAMAKRDQLKA